ncbi:hypothetical protein DFJ74DRAFT_397049 [Hyaloraphidium curvatum]|nr:hypothetical protein DFJ74DRAFT_397049 [Hyaloraphidium curvatum]
MPPPRVYSIPFGAALGMPTESDPDPFSEMNLPIDAVLDDENAEAAKLAEQMARKQLHRVIIEFEEEECAFCRSEAVKLAATFSKKKLKTGKRFLDLVFHVLPIYEDSKCGKAALKLSVLSVSAAGHHDCEACGRKSCKVSRKVSIVCSYPDCTQNSKPDPLREMKRCSRCKGAWYCGPACQKAHWPEHKQDCSK